MIESLRLVFDVPCPPDQAFSLWTEGTSAWWPASHTLARVKGTRIIFEPRRGGRVFERTPAGQEHEWGVILEWEPPVRLVYRWHIFSDSNDATEVEVRFIANGDGATTVELEHRGWDAFEDGRHRQERNSAAWHSLLPLYRQAAARHERSAL